MLLGEAGEPQHPRVAQHPGGGGENGEVWHPKVLHAPPAWGDLGGCIHYPEVMGLTEASGCQMGGGAQHPEASRGPGAAQHPGVQAQHRGRAPNSPRGAQCCGDEPPPPQGAFWLPGGGHQRGSPPPQGYSVSSLRLPGGQRLFVAGAPRFQHRGKVIVFQMGATGTVTVAQALLGEQVRG